MEIENKDRDREDGRGQGTYHIAIEKNIQEDFAYAITEMIIIIIFVIMSKHRAITHGDK